MPLCFAYGSNMDRAGMAVRCPGARPLAIGRLARHRFTIMRSGYASVIRDVRRDVWGLLWDVPLGEVAALDRYEGVSGGLYVKAILPVLVAGGSRRALVYVGNDAGPGRPRPGYMEVVLAAARAAGLPPAHLAELAGWLPGDAERVAASRPVEGRPAVRPTRGTPNDPPRRIEGWTP